MPKTLLFDFTIISHSALYTTSTPRTAFPHERGPATQLITRNTTIESPFKQLQPAAASKAQSKTYDHKTCFQQKSWPPDADRTPNVRDGTSTIGTTQKNTNNVPLQTREHAWAGISGTPRTAGLEGHSTSRGAEP